MESCIKLGQDLLHYLTVDIGQPEVAALVLESELRVVDSQAMEDGCVQVVHMDRILGDVVAIVVRLAECDSRLYAAAGHPDGKAAGMMIATVVVRGQLALTIHGAPEFAAPDNQRVLQKAPLFQILDERRARLVGVPALTRDLFGQLVVLVPALVEQLNEPNAAFDEAAGQEAIGGEGTPRS